MIKFIDVDRILKLCILYIYIYKEYFRLSQAYLFRVHIFSTQLFWVPFYFKSICFRFVSTNITCYCKQTNQVSVARRQQMKVSQKTWAISILSSPNHGTQYNMCSSVCVCVCVYIYIYIVLAWECWLQKEKKRREEMMFWVQIFSWNLRERNS